MLDEQNIPAGLLHKNLKELDILNKFAGGQRTSLKGIKQLVSSHSQTYHIVDLGCGSGDVLKHIADWARVNKYKVRLTGVDFNKEVVTHLITHCADYPEITGVCAGYSDYLQQDIPIDIVHCSLFCHHLIDQELVDLFVYFRRKLRCGFVINDLQRNRLAYFAAWLLPRILHGTDLAKNDGPISVLRGFKSEEIRFLMAKAGIQNYSIQKAWAFRFLIVGKI